MHRETLPRQVGADMEINRDTLQMREGSGTRAWDPDHAGTSSGSLRVVLASLPENGEHQVFSVLVSGSQKDACFEVC